MSSILVQQISLIVCHVFLVCGVDCVFFVLYVIEDGMWRRVFAKRVIFSSLLCIFSVDMEMYTIGGMVGGPTLGDTVG